MKSWSELLNFLPVPGVAYGVPRADAVAPLNALANDLTLLGGPIHDKSSALACLSALWLRFDHFDKSHSISQDLENQDGSYWHGIAHRREGDFTNACYWFRRVGTHRVEATITSLLQNKKMVSTGTIFSPSSFTRMVERRGDENLLMDIQEVEWRTLFDDCLHRALGHTT